MAGIFGEFFLVSVSQETKRENSSKNSGKIRREIRGKNSGQKFKKFGELSDCDFPDLRYCFSNLLVGVSVVGHGSVDFNTDLS